MNSPRRETRDHATRAFENSGLQISKLLDGLVTGLVIICELILSIVSGHNQLTNTKFTRPATQISKSTDLCAFLSEHSVVVADLCGDCGVAEDARLHVDDQLVCVVEAHLAVDHFGLIAEAREHVAEQHD